MAFSKIVYDGGSGDIILTTTSTQNQEQSFATLSGAAPLPTSSLTQTSPTLTATAGQGLTLDATGNVPVGVAAQSIPMLTADPTNPSIGQIWYRTDTSQLSVRHDAGTTKRVTLA